MHRSILKNAYKKKKIILYHLQHNIIIVPTHFARKHCLKRKVAVYFNFVIIYSYNLLSSFKINNDDEVNTLNFYVLKLFIED